MNATRRGFIATVDSALRPTGEHTPPAAGPRRREERAHGSRSGPAVRAGCRDLRESDDQKLEVVKAIARTLTVGGLRMQTNSRRAIGTWRVLVTRARVPESRGGG